MQSMSRGAAAFFGSALFVPVVGVLVFLFASSPCDGVGGELGATCVGSQTSVGGSPAGALPGW